MVWLMFLIYIVSGVVITFLGVKRIPGFCRDAQDKPDGLLMLLSVSVWPFILIGILVALIAMLLEALANRLKL